MACLDGSSLNRSFRASIHDRPPVLSDLRCSFSTTDSRCSAFDILSSEYTSHLCQYASVLPVVRKIEGGNSKGCRRSEGAIFCSHTSSSFAAACNLSFKRVHVMSRIGSHNRAICTRQSNWNLSCTIFQSRLPGITICVKPSLTASRKPFKI